MLTPAGIERERGVSAKVSRHLSRFHRLFSRRGHTPFIAGNRLTLFPQGSDFFPPLFEAIDGACQAICAEFYIIRDDATGQAFADRLIAAALRSVHVYLLYDYIGCIDTPATYFKRLTAAGVRCIPFNPPRFTRRIRFLDHRDHRKLAIVDNQYAFVAGLNIGDEYAGLGDPHKQLRDLGVRLEGPVVARLQQLFTLAWLRQGGEGLPLARVRAEGSKVEKPGDARVLVVAGRPGQNRSFIRSAFRRAMAGTGQCIDIVTPYFIPGPFVLRSLMKAARRGVTVRLVLPAVSDVPFVRLLSRSYYGTLLKAGVQIFERQGTILHAKLMAIDSRWVVIGSANMDLRSFHRN
ncbi:MAG TPA: phospholipase D-like domain-containing protein, partial [Geobacterales bacterium]|nr:phospholipase D-like domain-containing protein [Geobacterales bacterium]